MARPLVTAVVPTANGLRRKVIWRMEHRARRVVDHALDPQIQTAVWELGLVGDPAATEARQDVRTQSYHARRGIILTATPVYNVRINTKADQPARQA